MPSDAEPFLQRIRAFPDDDSQRLIYADWLEEQGGAEADRAAFIRVQVALSSLAADDARRPGLLHAERSLLEAYKSDWEAPVRGLATGPVFRRGFVDEVKVAAKQFLRHSDELFAAGPIRHIHLLDVGTSLDAVMESAFLSRLTALTVFAQHAGEALARGIARCPHLAGLQSLSLSRNRLEDDAALHLAGSPFLASLVELDLSENEISEAGGRALAASLHLGNVKRLELRHNPLGPGGAEAIAGSERLAALERLGLGGAGLGVPRLHALTRVASLLQIPSLDLTANGLGPNGLKAILNRAPARTDVPPVRLRELDLSHNELGEAGARVLAECAALKDLQVLRLAGCGITDAAVRQLTQSPNLNNLTTLELSNNPVGDSGLRDFLDRQRLRSLRTLTLPLGVSPRMQSALEKRFRRRPRTDSRL